MAPTVHSKLWAAEATIFENATIGASAISYSSFIDLETSGYEGAHITGDITFNASATSDVDVNIYGGLSTSDPDDIALFSQSVSVSAGNSRQISLVVRDVAYVRLGVAHTSSETTNQASVNIRHQRWKWKST